MSHSDNGLEPNIDNLFSWAENQPDLLQQWLEQEVKDLIENAPVSHQDKLRGLQFKIEMEKRRAKNPLASCIAISNLMYESFYKLKIALADVDYSNPYKPHKITENKAKVLPFKLKGVNNKSSS